MGIACCQEGERSRPCTVPTRPCMPKRLATTRRGSAVWPPRCRRRQPSRPSMRGMAADVRPAVVQVNPCHQANEHQQQRDAGQCRGEYITSSATMGPMPLAVEPTNACSDDAMPRRCGCRSSTSRRDHHAPSAPSRTRRCRWALRAQSTWVPAAGWPRVQCRDQQHDDKPWRIWRFGAMRPHQAAVIRAPPMMPEMVTRKNQKNCVGSAPARRREGRADSVQEHAVERNAAGQCQKHEARAGSVPQYHVCRWMGSLGHDSGSQR